MAITRQPAANSRVAVNLPMPDEQPVIRTHLQDGDGSIVGRARVDDG